MARIRLALCLAALAAPALPAAAADSTSAIPSVVAPYRFEPAPGTLTPLEQEKAERYKTQLQERVFDFERDQPRLDILEDEELRRLRGELDRMHRVIQQGTTR
jgi:hypothetical protein